MSIRSFQDFHGLNEADTWTVYYKKGSFGREVVKSGLSKQAATRLYNKLSADIPSEYDGVEMVMEAVSDAQIRKVMKLTKNRPAPFAVVAVKGGKVVAQDIDIKTWELVLAHYREMAKAHPDAKIHVEDAEGQSVMESADMLPSYEVLIGLATVMGALDLVQAARGGDSIIVDVAKALKAELGDKLEAAGAEAKRMVSKFKNDPKIKEIIMDAEEEVNESKRSTAMKISLFEVTETGLMVIPHTNADANKIQKWVDKSGMYGEWDAREGYFLFPEEEDGFDELETELTKELNKLGVNYHIEGVFESNKSKQKDMTKIKLFEEYFNEAAPSPRHFTSPDYVGPEFAKKASDEDVQLLVKLKGEKLKMHDKHVRPIEDQIAKLMKKYGIKGIEESLSEAAPKIYKTISKKEWDRTPADYKSVIDGVHYKMFNDPKMGTILAPVEISESLMEREYNTAQRREMEHTKDPEIAAEIARDHLYEDPKYYTKLATIEEGRKPKGAPSWSESDAPDAEGRFKDLSPKKLAAWLIKTRKKDLRKITGSLNQQIVFNRKEDPKYAEKMEKTRKEVYKQLGREDLLEEGFGSRLLDTIYDTISTDYPAYMKDIKNLLRYIERDKRIHPSMSREILSQIILTKI